MFPFNQKAVVVCVPLESPHRDAKCERSLPRREPPLLMENHVYEIGSSLIESQTSQQASRLVVTSRLDQSGIAPRRICNNSTERPRAKPWTEVFTLGITP
jgi:hypothetical protein